MSLRKFKSTNWYVCPIWADIFLHPCQNTLSMIYLYDLDTGDEHVININNLDDNAIAEDAVEIIGDQIFVVDKKSFLNSNVQLTGVGLDAAFVKYMSAVENLNTPTTSAHTHLYRKFNKLKNINNIVPISKHIEVAVEMRDEFLRYYDPQMITDHYIYIDRCYSDAFYEIEKNGICTSTGMEYTQYNPYTATSRPSNAFNGVNYAALPKEDGTRDKYVSRYDNGILAQFDYDAYHLRLIGELVNYSFPYDIELHQMFSKEYGSTYNDSKKISFRQLYGGVEDKYKHIPYFKAVSKYVDDMWNSFRKNGYVETPILKRKIFANTFTRMSKTKLFNYIIQALETENNLPVILAISEFLKNKRTKLVLYTYDAYLFDFHPAEFSVINDLRILIEKNKYPTKIEAGYKYSQMKEINYEDFRRDSSVMVD